MHRVAVGEKLWVRDELRRSSELTGAISSFIHETNEVDTLPSLFRTPDFRSRVKNAGNQFSLPPNPKYFILDVFAAQTDMNAVGTVTAV